MTGDHMLDSVGPRSAAETVLAMARVTADDAGVTDQIRADARDLLDLGVVELTALFTPGLSEERSSAPGGSLLPSLAVLVNEMSERGARSASDDLDSVHRTRLTAGE